MEGVERIVLSKRKYIICASTFGKSAGQRVLYNLREELEDRGYEAFIFCYGKRNYDPKVFIDKITDDNRQNDIVIYPEIIEGNPLRFRNVARYILQDPKFWGMSDAFDKREMLFAFDSFCYPNIPLLRADTIERNLFFDSHTPKDVNCYFVYKRGKFREVPEIEGWTEINMHWPESREELAKFLQRTKYLYSYDCCSSVLAEAKLCGAEVKIITNDGIVDYKENDNFNKDKFSQQLDFFIKTTQSNNLVGDIDTNGSFSQLDYIMNKIYCFGISIIYMVSRSQKIKKFLKNEKLHKCNRNYIFKYKRKIYDV